MNGVFEEGHLRFFEDAIKELADSVLHAHAGDADATESRSVTTSSASPPMSN